MPSYAIKSSGIRQVAASRLIGNSTGSTGSAEELSATAAKTLLGLGSSDGPTFASATIGGVSISSVGMITTPTGNGSGTAGGLMLGNSIGWISRGTGSVELASGSAEYIEMASDGITLRTGLSFGWSANNNPQDGSGPRLWENTTTERIELRRGTTALGFAVANTWTDASNLEFGVFDFTTTSNVLTIGAEAAGTGTLRAVDFIGSAFDFDNKTITAGELQLGNTGQCKLDFAGTSLYATGPEGIIFRFESDTTNTSIFKFYGNSGDQLTASSGVQSFFDVDADVNQSSTAGYTGIDLDITETATGSGDKNLMDLKVGGTSKFKVDNAGGLTTTGTAVLGNYDFNTAETVGAGQDNYILTYDNSSGKIGLEAAGGGNPFDQDLNTTDSPTFDDLTTTGDANISNSNTGKLTINGTTYGIKRSGSGFGFLLNNQHRFVMKTDRSAISGVYSGSTPHYFGFTNTTHADTASSAVDVRLQREAANHLAMVNGTNASTFSVSNTFTDASNYERGVLKWDSNILKFGTESAGTGSDRIVQFVGSGVSMPSIPTSDPASAGELWNDSGTLKVSAG